MSFETFWQDPRIPPRMKRCGKPKVRKALQKRGLDNPEGYEKVAASLPGYNRDKPDYHDHHMLSTFINQELDEVEWSEMNERVNGIRVEDMSYEQRRQLTRIVR